MSKILARATFAFLPASPLSLLMGNRQIWQVVITWLVSLWCYRKPGTECLGHNCVITGTGQWPKLLRTHLKSPSFNSFLTSNSQWMSSYNPRTICKSQKQRNRSVWNAHQCLDVILKRFTYSFSDFVPDTEIRQLNNASCWFVEIPHFTKLWCFGLYPLPVS